MQHHEVLNPDQFDLEGLLGPMGSYGDPWAPMGPGYAGSIAEGISV